MPSRCEGLRAVVTGAGSGIGLATARRLRAEGASVAALDLRPPSDLELVAITVDVRDRASMHAAADEVQHRLGGTDLLVCNAGVGSVGTVADHSDEEWHDVWDVNVVGIARTVTAFLPQLRRSTSASIVCTSSVAANIGLVQRAIYSATKGAVSALTMSMAADLITDGIRVNAVCPGTADTPWIGRLLDAAPDPDAARAALVARQPMLRLGRAEEIADAIVYLSGPQAGFVTGTMLNIDGGMVGMRVQR